MEFFLGAFTAEWEQRRAALLHDLSLGRTKPEDEEQRRRRAGAAVTAGPAGAATGSQWSAMVSRRPATKRARLFAERPMRARFAGLAAGGQPAVVKMASFGGGARLGAMINYVSRNGAVVAENERGDELRGRDRLSAVGSEWDHLMMNRAESRDIGVFRVCVADDGYPADDLFGRARKIVRQGLGDRAFALAVTERSDGSGFDIDGITVLRSAQGERLSGDGKAAAIVQQRLDEAGSQAVGSADFQFTGYGNGTDYGSARLRSLVEAHKGKVEDEQGRSIPDGKRAGELVQLDWRGQLHSRKPRDVMHLVLSARAGTDAAAFGDAARDFLGTQFAGHRYVFSLHDAASDPKAEATGGKRPHVHVHAIIAMRSDAGDRIETTIPAFRQWRLTMAEKARAHGINMEMTDRRDRASPPAYAHNQVRPVNMIGRTQHAGTSAAAQRRYDAKRADEERFARTPQSQAYARTAQREWQSVGASGLLPGQKDFADAQLIRFEAEPWRGEAKTVRHDQLSHAAAPLRTHLARLTDLVAEYDDMRHMTRPEFEAYEKRVERALFQAERVLPPHEQDAFADIARAARDHVNVRREIVDLLEERNRDTSRDTPDRSPAVHEPDDGTLRWNNAVERHGYAAAAAANRQLVGIEQSRETISRAEADSQDPETIRALKQDLEHRLIRTAELGADGNALIREVAESDADLKAVLQAVEHERHRAERARSPSGPEANEVGGLAAVRVPDASLTQDRDGQSRDTPDRSPSVNAPDDGTQRWNSAVLRHGYAAAAAANRQLVGIEQSRETISRAEADSQDPETIRALKQDLDNRLIRTAELGADGNALIREVAEIDADLKAVLQVVEHERHRAGRTRSPSGAEANEVSGLAAGSAPGASLTQDRDGQSRNADGRKTDAMAGPKGDTTRGDPARQHVPRLQQLQRDADEQRARDRDDRDR